MLSQVTQVDRTKNPTYKEVTYGDTGHIETIEVKYDLKKTNFKKLLDIFWVKALIHLMLVYGQFW